MLRELKNPMDLILRAYLTALILQVITGGERHKSLSYGLNLLMLHLLDLNVLNLGWEKEVLEEV